MNRCQDEALISSVGPDAFVTIANRPGRVNTRWPGVLFKSMTRRSGSLKLTRSTVAVSTTSNCFVQPERATAHWSYTPSSLEVVDCSINLVVSGMELASVLSPLIDTFGR